MGPKQTGAAIEKIGGYLMILGGACIGLIFAIVLVNGAWPEFLGPVQDRAKIISDLVGDLVILVWVIAFVGPGFLVQLLGQWLQSD